VVGEPKHLANFDPQNPYFRRRSSFDLPNTPASCRVGETGRLPAYSGESERSFRANVNARSG
jgi:hypothetical protein